MKSCTAFIGARSAGHILPALALAHQEKKIYNAQILFLTSTATLDIRTLHNQSFIDYHIPLHLNNVPGNIFLLLPYGFTFLACILHCFYIFLKYRPKRLVSTGGYLSIPAILAAWSLRIPIELYELNALPGKAILYSTRFATTINCVYDQACSYFPKHKTSLVSYPTRLQSTDKISQKDALKQLGWDDNKKTLFILGGSQGSSYINQLIMSNIHLFRSDLYIIHQTGIQDYEQYKELYEQYSITNRTFAYTHNLIPFYNAADIILCRAGAGTLAEIVFFQKRAIVIPLEIQSTHHQVDNALAMQKKYPHLIHVLRQHEIKNNPMILTTLWLHLLHLANYQVACPIHMHSN